MGEDERAFQAVSNIMEHLDEDAIYQIYKCVRHHGP